MPVEHVFLGCQLGVQENPLSDAFQIVIIDPAIQHVYRLPISREDLEGYREEIDKVLGDTTPKLQIERPGMSDISKINGSRKDI